MKGKTVLQAKLSRSSIDREIGSQSVNQIASTTWQKVISVPIERNLHISLEEVFFSHVTWILPFFEKPTEPFSHSAFHFTRTFYQPSKKSPNRTIFFFMSLVPPHLLHFAGDLSPPPSLSELGKSGHMQYFAGKIISQGRGNSAWVPSAPSP